MRITFTISGLSEERLKELTSGTPEEIRRSATGLACRWTQRMHDLKMSGRTRAPRRGEAGPPRVSMKIGNGEFRDQVEYNLMAQQGATAVQVTIGSRRGYTLLDVEFRVSNESPA